MAAVGTEPAVESELGAAVQRALLESVLDGPEPRCFGFKRDDCPNPVAYLVSCPYGDAQEYLCAPCMAEIRRRSERRYLFGLLTPVIVFEKSCGHAVPLADCAIRPI